MFCSAPEWEREENELFSSNTRRVRPAYTAVSCRRSEGISAQSTPLAKEQPLGYWPERKKLKVPERAMGMFLLELSAEERVSLRKGEVGARLSSISQMESGEKGKISTIITPGKLIVLRGLKVNGACISHEAVLTLPSQITLKCF